MFALVVSTAHAADNKIDPAKLTNTVTISLGQKFDVQFKQQSNVLSNPKIIKDISKNIDAKLSLDFRKDKNIMLLIIRNKFEKILRFRAFAHFQDEIFETSILPVGSKMSNYESWPDPIQELILFDFKLTDEL